MVFTEGATLSEPLTALPPDQPPLLSDPPLALQLVAFSTDQLSVVLAPLSMLVLAALKLICGRSAITVTVTESLIVPPGPLQDSRNEVSLLSGPTFSLPPADFAPLQPPLALQLSTLSADQLRTTESPLLTLTSLAVSDSEGSSALTVMLTEAESLPPSPVQDST